MLVMQWFHFMTLCFRAPAMAIVKLLEACKLAQGRKPFMHYEWCLRLDKVNFESWQSCTYTNAILLHVM